MSSLSPTETDEAEQADAWLFWALAAVLVFAPLPLGSNRNWALALLAFATGALLLLSWITAMWHGRSPLALLKPARLPLVCLGAYAALVAAQWLGGSRGSVFFSADPYQTRYYLVCCLTYTAMFTSVMLLVRSTWRVRALSVVLVGSGVLQALLAIYWLSIGAQYQFMFEDIAHGAQTTGTFVNRNHLAGYLYLSLSAGIGLLLGSLVTQGPAPRRLRDHLVNALKFMLSSRMALRTLMVVMVVALVLTRSRMGNTAFFSALVILGIVVAVTTPALRLKALVLVISMVAIDVVVVGQWVGLDRVVQRLDGTAVAKADQRGEETIESRLDPAWYSMAMIAARPLVGWGGGTYYIAFPAFKSREMILHRDLIDHAHNDYIEITSDTGIVGLLLLATVVLTSLRRAWQLLVRRGQPTLGKGAAYAGLMAITCLLLHSAVDFNLQIPANALTIVTLLALVWATPLEGSKASQTAKAPAPEPAGDPVTADIAIGLPLAVPA